MIRTPEVAASAPAKFRRAERRRWRGWTSGLVALATVVGVAVVPVLGAAPAGALPPSVTIVAGHNGGTPPTPGGPVEAALAQVNPVYEAYNPANGDEAIASTKAGSVYVYLLAGPSDTNNEYNIETAPGSPPATPPAFGPLVAGDVYIMAGTGTAGLIAQPGNNQFGNSTSAVATQNPIEPTSVAFDNNGNVLIAGENLSTGKSAIQVVAKANGTFYGVPMIAGDLYTIGDVGLAGSPSTAINMGTTAAAANGISVDATGNIAVGDGDGVIFVNEQSSGSLSLYGRTIAHQSAAVVAGNNQGTTDCSPGATSDPASSQFFQSPAPTLDASDNLYFGDNEAGGSNGGGCVWVEPAQSGTLANLGLGAVTAGNVYKLAGNGGATPTADGTAGVQSNVAGTAQVALDNAGNVVLAVQSASGDGNLPAIQVLAESTGTYYGTSMTAGDIYTVAGGSGNTLATLSGPTSVLNIGGGNLLFTDGTNTSANLDELSGAPTEGVPTVTSVVPNSGHAAGGASVTITGTNFIGATAVDFGANAATGVVVNSATSITATAPAGTGTVDVTVTTPVATSSANPGDQFTYIAVPTVTNVNPNAGPTAGGTIVTITGTALTGATAVDFGANAATGVVVNSDTSITATSPAGTAGTVDVTVTTPGGPSVANTGDQFTYVAAPTVTNVNPNVGPTVGGTSVTITGTNLTGATAVDFGANAATGVIVKSDTSITATSPAGIAGTVDVTVTTAGGPSLANTGDQFTYVAGPAVTAVSPAFGPSTGGTSVTITGVDLTGATAVSFGANPATGVIVNSDTSVTATSPAGTAGTTVDVTVTTPGGTSLANPPGDQFTYTGPAGGTVTLKKTTSLIGNYPEQVSGTGWKADTTVTLNECVTPAYSFGSCDAVNQKTVTLGTGKLAGIFKGQVIDLAVGVIDTHGDTCGIAGSPTCYVVVVGNSGDSSTSVALGFRLSEFVTKATQKVIGNYHDPIKAGGFPIGDTIVAQECDSNVAGPLTIATNCDPVTDISMTAGATGGAVFVPGLELLAGGAYSDTAAGTCPAGGTCEIVVTDKQNPSIFLELAVSFGTPAAFLHKTTAVPNGYLDGVKGAVFPIGDTITATECESGVTPANMATFCDGATTVSTTTAPNGKAVFPVGVPVRDGGSYTDTNGGTVNPGGSAVIVINDSTNSGFYVAVPITMAP